MRLVCRVFMYVVQMFKKNLALEGRSCCENSKQRRLDMNALNDRTTSNQRYSKLLVLRSTILYVCEIEKLFSQHQRT